MTHALRRRYGNDDDLNPTQRAILERLVDKGRANSGLGGFPERCFHMLERRGLVRLVGEWPTKKGKDWALTDAGRPIAEKIHAELNAGRPASVAALKEAVGEELAAELMKRHYY